MNLRYRAAIYAMSAISYDNGDRKCCDKRAVSLLLTLRLLLSYEIANLLTSFIMHLSGLFQKEHAHSEQFP